MHHSQATCDDEIFAMTNSKMLLVTSTWLIVFILGKNNASGAEFQCQR